MNSNLKSVLSSYRKRIGQVLPIQPLFHKCIGVSQVFLNKPHIKTTYQLINFPSLYSPEKAVACRYEIQLFDPEGALVARKDVTIPIYGSKALRLEDLFSVHLPDYGMMVARIRPNSPYAYPYSHLGDLTSHFYTLYHDELKNALALVHCQTAFGKNAEPDIQWKSALTIDGTKGETLEIYQLNPGYETVPSLLTLVDSERNVLRREMATLMPCSTRRVAWSTEDLRGKKDLSIALSGLTGENAKPLIFTTFKDQSFSVSHS